MKKIERKIMITDRSLKNYLELLDLNIEELKGKKILDLGSGRLQRFPRELLQKIEDKAEVVGLDITLKEEERRKEIKEAQPYLYNSDKLGLIAASFLQLPFQDNSFDLVLSLYGMPLYLTSEDEEMSKENIRRSVMEILRVLKPGGEARIFPSNDYLEQVLREEKIQFSKKNKTILVTGTLITEIEEYLSKESKSINYNLVCFKKPH